MNDELRHPKLFPLTIRLDSDGIDWTHFVGSLRHVLTLLELPEAIQTRAVELIQHLSEGGVGVLEFLPSLPSKCRINDLVDELPTREKPALHETLLLLSWWIEWSHRRTVAHEWWHCPECHGKVERNLGHCDNSTCLSWDLLFKITGEAILELVEDAKTA